MSDAAARASARRTSPRLETSIERADRALRRLELDVTRRLDGLLQGDHLGLGARAGLGGGGEPGVRGRRRRAPHGLGGHRPHRRAARPRHRSPTGSSRPGWSSTAPRASTSAPRSARSATSRSRRSPRSASSPAGSATASARWCSPPTAHASCPRAAVATRRSRCCDASTRSPRSATASGTSDASTWNTRWRSTARVARRRGLVVVVSDFLARDRVGAPTSSARGAPRGARDRHRRSARARAAARRPRHASSTPRPAAASRCRPRARRSAPGTPRPRPRNAPRSQRAVVGAGAEHLVLRTDRDWLVDVARYVDTPPRAAVARIASVARGRGSTRVSFLAADRLVAARARRRPARRVRRRAAPAPARTRCASPTSICSRPSRRSARVGAAISRRRARCSR